MRCSINTYELRHWGAKKKHLVLRSKVCMANLWGKHHEFRGWRFKKERTGRPKQRHLSHLDEEHEPRACLRNTVYCCSVHALHKWLAKREWVPEFSSLHLPNREPVGHICPDVTSFTNSHKDSVLWRSLVFLAKTTTTTTKSLLQVYSSYTVMMLLCGPEEKKITTIQLSTGGLNKMLYHWFLSTKLSRDVAGVFLIDLPKNI